MKGYIYKIRNKINNKIYIGQTYYLKRRFKDHKQNRYHNPHFKFAIKHYGTENFEYSIIHEFNVEDKSSLKKILNHLETFWILALQTNNPNKGYNANIGGNGNVGMKFSEKSRLKMSKTASTGIHRGAKNGKAKSVFQYSLDNKFIKKWDCITDVERTLGIKVTAICNNLKGYSRTSGGYIWKYEQ